ncbi:dipeptide/tripeptide permease [Dietzia sp. NCCP-2495]|uniref:peptide MFS transporter n=1 Tax=Dietzia sp. NCCP-2495 TaxID=2934675 RepID=UPI002231B747|nr:peptide MFS transporter [Dietzia sp. NCCP-2495]GLB63070.1 dipeptide/tripeptide permease [Dietzia sp. NCCP-2495]
MTAQNPEVALADKDRRFFGHPLGLANLSGIELWERFSFYGMQGLLAYYIYYSVGEGGLGYSEQIATSIVGAYGGLVYASAILGAWVSDRLFGAERTLFGAAIMIMLGHTSLALVPGALGLGIGLVLVAVGAGTLKATTSTVVGDMYQRTDDRRDAAFSIYYMAVNIGGLLGPLITGALWDTHGFHWGFGAAAVGMAIGLVQYIIMRGSTLKGVGVDVPDPLPRPQRVRYLGGGLVVGILVAAAIATGLIPLESLANIVTAIAVIGAVALFALLIGSRKTQADERRRVISFIPMFVASVMFWALFQQQFTVIAIYSDQRLDRNIGGWEVPASWVQSINPLFIIIFAAVFATMWVKLGDRQPSTPMKFALSNLIMGIAAMIFMLFAGHESTPILGIVGILFLFTMAELLLSPVGQSLATKLAPEAFKTQMLALFFLTVSIGSALSGVLAGYYDPSDAGAERTYFLVLGIASIAVAVVIALLSPWIRKNMVGVR